MKDEEKTEIKSLIKEFVDSKASSAKTSAAGKKKKAGGASSETKATAGVWMLLLLLLLLFCPFNTPPQSYIHCVVEIPSTDTSVVTRYLLVRCPDSRGGTCCTAMGQECLGLAPVAGNLWLVLLGI